MITVAQGARLRFVRQAEDPKAVGAVNPENSSANVAAEGPKDELDERQGHHHHHHGIPY